MRVVPSVPERAEDAERAAYNDADDEDHACHAHEPRSGDRLGPAPVRATAVTRISANAIQTSEFMART
jgi:hypothetical protein